MNNVAYASNTVTLDDYFRSDICRGKSIYCAFEMDSESIEAMYIARKMLKCGVDRIEFQNGLVLYPDSSMTTKESLALYLICDEGSEVLRA